MDKVYDIRQRTLMFSKDLLLFTPKLSKSDENLIIKKQIIRCGTSIGANVFESNGGHSKRDFANFMNIALKSANETIYWFSLLKDLNPTLKDSINLLEKEASELAKIIAKICINVRKEL